MSQIEKRALRLALAVLLVLSLSVSVSSIAFADVAGMDAADLAAIQAACTHPSFSEQYCEAAHPHENFKYCTSCWKKFYTGGYTTKAHGDGSTGSGTCPDCGSHRYVGQSCERPGTCICGDTIPASGHVYSPIYSEAAHPHYYYRECSVCHYINYTGGHATKNHGDGSWGSGTCPSCGTHTYAGRSCTSPGTCVCGATIAAYGHSLSGSVYYESSHPHRAYQYCSTCAGKSYTGATQTLPHGDGSNGTCRSCGTHSYEPSSNISGPHPHSTTWSCACGTQYNSYTYNFNCVTCRANMETANNSTTSSGVLMYIDGDIDTIVSDTDVRLNSDSDGTLGGGGLISVQITLTLTHTSTYNFPAEDVDNMGLYNFPPFHTSLFSTAVTTNNLDAPQIVTHVRDTATYFDSAGNAIATRYLDINAPDPFSIWRMDSPFTLSTVPAYCYATASCSFSGGSGTGNEVVARLYSYF